MNAYLMLLEEEEKQLDTTISTSTSETTPVDENKVRKNFLKLTFEKVWNFIKKIFNASAAYLKSKFNKISSLFKWGALVSLATFAVSFFVSKRSVIAYINSNEETKSYPYVNEASILSATAITIIVFSIFLAAWKFKNRKKVNTTEEPSMDTSPKDVLSSENLYLNKFDLNIYKENAEETNTTTAEIVEEVKLKWWQKIKKFLVDNYSNVVSFLNTKLKWNMRSTKWKVIFSVSVGSILALLFAIVFFKLKGKPIRYIFELMVNFVKSHPYHVGGTIAILAIAVCLYFAWPSIKNFWNKSNKKENNTKEDNI